MEEERTEQEKCPECTQQCDGMSLYECEICDQAHCGKCEHDED